MNYFIAIVGVLVMILTWASIISMLREIPKKRAEEERAYYKREIDTIEYALSRLEDSEKDADKIRAKAYTQSEKNYEDRSELESAVFALEEQSKELSGVRASALPVSGLLCHDKPIVMDTRFFHPFQIGQYADALGGAIARRALEEDIRVDIRRVDVRNVPYALYATVSSFKYSGVNEYETSLVACTCPYNSKNDKVCKHMMALAIKSGAVSVDAGSLLK